jgi:hypothetical protein
MSHLLGRWLQPDHRLVEPGAVDQKDLHRPATEARVDALAVLAKRLQGPIFGEHLPDRLPVDLGGIGIVGPEVVVIPGAKRGAGADQLGKARLGEKLPMPPPIRRQIRGVDVGRVATEQHRFNALRSQIAGNFSDAQEPKARQARPGRSAGGAVCRGQGPTGAASPPPECQVNE